MMGVAVTPQAHALVRVERQHNALVATGACRCGHEYRGPSKQDIRRQHRDHRRIHGYR